MFFNHIRPINPVRALLTVVLGTVLMSLLFLPEQVPNENRLALDWRPEIEVLLLVGLVAVFAALGRRMPTALRWTAASLLTLGALLHGIAAAVPSFFERELDLYWDLPHVPSLIGLFVAAKGWVKASLVMLGLVVGLIVLVAVIALVLRLMERALRGRSRPQLALVVVGLSLVLLPIPWPAVGSLATAGLSAEVGRQIGNAWFSFRVLNGGAGPYGEALASPEPPVRDLKKLGGHDVYLVFFESYGTTVLDDPQFAADIKPALAEFETSAEDAGYYIVSNRIDSPTFGGGSWLAHGTIASGLKLDRFLYRLLLSSKRRTLPQYFAAAGYRSLNIMPGIKKPWPEGDYWGFDRLINGKDLGYDGPAFGWFDIPDQWTLKKALEVVDAEPHPPQFTQIVLVSSHTPFAPVPPYVEDWSDVGPYKEIAQEEWTKIYKDPDWWHLEAPYLQSVKYDLKALAGWMRQLKGQPLIIILGDHQPPGFVSGAEAPHTVPIHVLSRDEDLVLPFTNLGYVAGAIPPEAGPFKGMESFLPDFLSVFASGHSVASAPDAAVPDP
ncbi:MAG TPA: sulfatase-like hydrolase/transferase [Stellaceae bacterium]|nr:sulfatase-like hydrolase/transferase [Stellaceae bacterium]